MVLRAGLQDLSCSIRTLLGCSQYAGHRGQQESDAWDRHQQFTAHFSMTCLRMPKEHKLFHRGPKLMWKWCEAPPSARSHLAQLHTQVILQSPPSLHLSKWLLLYLSTISSFEGSSKRKAFVLGKSPAVNKESRRTQCGRGRRGGLIKVKYRSKSHMETCYSAH